jgi:DNA (cytosine-5)-methyltransferase 1
MLGQRGEEKLIDGATTCMDTTVPTFIDLFAGAGGLSLGLMMAGWKGLFAVEKSPMAFQTLKHNLIDQKDHLNFEWPVWLPQEAIDIQTLLEKYIERLRELRDIHLLAGGPPCQGFSNSGRRQYDDERNRLFEQYLELVKLIRPQMLLVENVQGFAKTFSKTEKGKKGEKIKTESFNADKELQRQLIELGYMPFTHYTVKAKDFGVPQLRPRYFLIAIRKDLLRSVPFPEPFQILYESVREKFLGERGLPRDREVTLQEAISDLERTHGDVQCIETDMERFRQGVYGPMQNKNPYQRLMRRSRYGKPLRKGKVADSHRFVNHTPEVEARLRLIITEFRPGIQLSDKEREKLGLNKHRIAPLAPGEACHTLTSLPDDLVHYSEPRIPTVREYARIQSFPDWFEFKAKYTTGDKERREQVPRYTQVANAVPPLLAEALGLTMREYLVRVSNLLNCDFSHSARGEASISYASETLEESSVLAAP